MSLGFSTLAPSELWSPPRCDTHSQHPHGRQHPNQPAKRNRRLLTSPEKAISSKQANARASFVCYFKDHIFATEMKALSFGLSGHLLKWLLDTSASTELNP